MAQITVINKATNATTTVMGSAVTLSASSVVELVLPHAQVKLFTRKGNDLVITTLAGQEITIHGFFVNGQIGHNSLVLQDDGGLWLSNLNDFNLLPAGTNIDPATKSVFSPIGSLDSLFRDTSDAATAPDSHFSHSFDPLSNDASSAGTATATAGNAATATTAATATPATTATVGDNGPGLGWLPIALAAGGMAAAIGSSSSGSGGTSSPTLGSIQQNANGTLTLSGHASPGDTLTATYPDQSTNTGIVNTDGSYSITSSGVQTSGSVSVADTSSDTTPATQIWTDTTPPVPPTGTMTLKANGDLTVSGMAEPGSTVTVTFPDHSISVVTAHSDGSYSVTSSTLQLSGDVSVTATDAAGNISALTSLAYTGLTSSLPVIINPFCLANADGTVTLSGTNQLIEGSTVTATFSDGSTATGTVGADGTYSITSSASEIATSSIVVTATDTAGHTSLLAEFSGLSVLPSLSLDSLTGNPNGTLTVSGQGYFGNTVTATYPDGSTATGTIDSSGHYAITSQSVQTAGSVSVSVTDASDNSTTSVTQTWAEATPLQVPIIDFPNTATNGTLNLSVQDVLNAHTPADQKLVVNSDNGTVSTVHLEEGIGNGANQWQDVGYAGSYGGVQYDSYHNANPGGDPINLLIQQGITVT